MSQDITQAINEVINSDLELRELFAPMMSRAPRWRYYEDKKGNWWFWTTERVVHLGREKFVAGKYRHIKTRGEHRLVKRVGFKLRRDAKAWALRHCEEMDKKAVQ